MPLAALQREQYMIRSKDKPSFFAPCIFVKRNYDRHSLVVAIKSHRELQIVSTKIAKGGEGSF